ncbi:MAG: HEAT repeat domain-containing protein [candidate division KSB1 bacterium]|nr:HEAT repeat domain-containing protein [candidate division KSB1 bacterium]
MKRRIVEHSLLILLALVFTIGLTFASVELPRVFDAYIHNQFSFPDIATISSQHIEPDTYNESAFRTELFLRHYHFREIGYICLLLIIALIIAGFVTEKIGYTTAGAVALFLPVFGHFALTMFFLGGLGFLRLLWMPLLDISENLLRLGDIIVYPYQWILNGASFIGLNIWRELPYIFIGIGFLLFTMGTLTWFYGKIKKQPITDFWIYRFSRHPQYLGWIIWSYGVLFLPGSRIKKMFEISNTLPWLLATMVIIGVALVEELKLKRTHGKSYALYQKSVPFIFPLPGFVKKIFSLPTRLLFKKSFPGEKLEIVAVLCIFTIVIMGMSFANTRISEMRQHSQIPDTEYEISDYEYQFIYNSDRRTKYHAAMALVNAGKPSEEIFIRLLKSEDEVEREFSAQALGKLKSKKAIPPLTATLQDPNWRVRNTAIVALQGINPVAVKTELISAFNDENGSCRYHAARALEKIGTEDVIDVLVSGLQDEAQYVRVACVNSLAFISSAKTVPPLISALNQESADVRRAAVLALILKGSKDAIASLQLLHDDPDWEVRLYAAEAIKMLRH